jgi:hypothetical protein
VSFAAIKFCVASQRVFIVVSVSVSSVRKLLDTPSYRLKRDNFKKEGKGGAQLIMLKAELSVLG